MEIQASLAILHLRKNPNTLEKNPILWGRSSTRHSFSSSSAFARPNFLTISPHLGEFRRFSWYCLVISSSFSGACPARALGRPGWGRAWQQRMKSILRLPRDTAWHQRRFWHRRFVLAFFLLGHNDLDL
jgi:hypothetical protein